MRNAFVRVLAALAWIAAAASVRAGPPLSPDPTGLWFDPAQPGWGLEVVQQGDIGFAVIFTYDSSHKPVWYVAPNLSGNGAPTVMQGTLYRTAIPNFSGGTFDPRAVGVTAVGNLQISYASAGAPRLLALGYSVDGVAVSKTLQAQTWSSSAQNLLGSYAGQFFFTKAADASSQCPSADTIASPPTPPTQPFAFSVDPGATADRANVRWTSGASTACRLDAAYARDGQLAGLAGDLQCATAPSPPAVPGDPVTVTSIVAGSSGFSGSARLQHTLTGGAVCSYNGTFGGVLQQAAARSGMNPDPTGLWFNPQESGWGLILTQQGPNIFAALFSYGTDGKAAWWVASNVVDTGQPVNLLVGEAFAGPLYGTTGPYLGAPDNTALAATQVGTLRVAYVGGTDLLSLSYTVNGTTVEKTLTRQTWSSNAGQLGGSYTGGLFPSASACGSGGIFAPRPTTFNVTPGTQPSSLLFTWGTGIDTVCQVDASYTQTGQLGSLSGLVQCGPVGNATATVGVLTVTSATVGASGFSGFANFTGNSCTAGGFVGGVRH